MDVTAKQFTPQPVRQSQESVDYLPVDTINNVFELIHKPLDWSVKNGKWLPNLNPIYFHAGLNNYDTDGVKDKEAVRRIYRSKGCACIVPDDPRLGKYMHYIGTVPAYNPTFGRPGKYYLTVFEQPSMVAGNVVWERDEAAYDAFREHLVTAGICVMNSTIASLVLSQKRQQLSNLDQIPDMGSNGARKKNLAHLTETVAQMEKLAKGLAGPKAAAVRRSFRVDPSLTADPEE